MGSPLATPCASWARLPRSRERQSRPWPATPNRSSCCASVWDVNRIAAVLRGVAALALTAGDPAWALRIAGAVHRVHATHGTRIYMDVAPAQKLWARTSWEHIRDAAQQALSPADAVAAWAAGQDTSLEQAIADALDWMATARV